MGLPEIWMKWDGSVFGVETLRRGVEKIERFGGDARDHFSGHSAPWERFAHAEDAAGAGDGCDDGVGIERFHTAEIDYFEFGAFAGHFFGDGKRFVDHC